MKNFLSDQIKHFIHDEILGLKPLIYAINKDWRLPKLIAKELGTTLHYVDILKFSDDEFIPEVMDKFRRARVYLIVENTPAQKYFEVRTAIDAFTRASVGEINLVFPYPGWLRQDRIKMNHTSLTAKMVYSDFDIQPKVVRFIVMDPHSVQSNLAVDKPWEILFSAQLFIERFKEIGIDPGKLTVVSSDFGAAHTTGYIARTYSKIMSLQKLSNGLGANLAIIDKNRVSDVATEVKRLIVEGAIRENVLFCDDMIASFGTGDSNVNYVFGEYPKIKRSFLAAPHPVLSGRAVELIGNSKLEKVFVTDTVHIPDEKQIDKIEELTASKIFANCIEEVNKPFGSVSQLYEPEQRK